jgi:ribonuclease BN (tRNA processing enzyme)
MVGRSCDGETARSGRMRLTVVGSGTSEPQLETAASGILVETGTFAVLVDCGQGVVRELLRIRDPRALDAIVVGHMHADHYIGLISLRYLMPWNGVTDRLQVYLPPGGRARIRDLASAISERPDFFDDAFEIVEYDPAEPIAVGDMTISFVPGRHYIPAWGCSIAALGGGRIVISGDTGPNEELVAAARGADVLVAEATLPSAADDDADRGHLTPEEALGIAALAGVPRTILVHYPASLRERIDAACARLLGATTGRAGLVVEIGTDADAPAPGPAAHGLGGHSASGVAPATLP